MNMKRVSRAYIVVPQSPQKPGALDIATIVRIVCGADMSISDRETDPVCVEGRWNRSHYGRRMMARS